MKWFKLILIFMVTCPALAQVRLVSYDKSSDTDFSAFNTFKFYRFEVSNDEVLKTKKDRIEYLKQSIISEMEARGFQYAEKDADLLINIGIVITDVTQTRETSIRDAPRYVGQRNYHWEAEEIVVRKYQEGTATIDFIDRQKNVMVWQGVVEAMVKEKEKAGKKNIDKGVQKLFNKFPVEVME